MAEQPGIEALLQTQWQKLKLHLEEAQSDIDQIRSQLEQVQIAHQMKERLASDLATARDSFTREANGLRTVMEQSYQAWKTAQHQQLQESQLQLKVEYQKIWQKLDNLEKFYAKIVACRETGKDAAK